MNCMQPMIKRLLSIILLAAGLQSGWGFALLGPNPISNPSFTGNVWQTTAIGYGLLYTSENDLPGGPVFLGDIGGPVNYSEGYRRNTPEIYYAYDASFLGFFGTDGAAAVDSAFAVMNNLTNVSTYSSGLSEFSTTSQHFNYTAQANYLTDLKSVSLHLMVETMGLADPERFSWTMAERITEPPGICPIDTEYLILQRNFAITPTPANQVQYSSYVNNELYTYSIVEFCTGTPTAFTVVSSADPLSLGYTAVAANDFDGQLGDDIGIGAGSENFSSGGGLQIGGYYTGLTRDDVGGLRHLLASNSIVVENPAAGSVLLTATTNFISPQLFPVSVQTNGVLLNGVFYGTADLGAFLRAAATNPPSVLTNLYPGLVVATSTNYFTVVTVTNVTAFFTNYIGSTFGSPPTLVFATNFTFAPMIIYVDTFANIITNHYHPNTVAKLVTTTVGPAVGSTVGSPPVTTTTSKNIILTNVPSGDFYILPTNSTCGLDIVSTLMTNVEMFTNIIFSTSGTNSTATNATGFSESESLVTRFTNYVFVIDPITCTQTTNATGLYEGVEKVNFVKSSFDSLVGQFFQPITNNYTMVGVNETNGQATLQHFQRIVTQPDILLDANDNIGANTFNGTVTRNINYDFSLLANGQAGPGVLNGPVTFSYNKIGDAFENGYEIAFVNGSLSIFSFSTNQLLSQLTQTPLLAWASFDGSTNAPELYPNGQSIQNLENSILVQISPNTLANGFANVTYPPVTFTITGGAFTSSVTWSASGLPPGMTVSSSGTLSGIPTLAGTYEVGLQLTDSLGRSGQWFYTLIIQ